MATEAPLARTMRSSLWGAAYLLGNRRTAHRCITAEAAATTATEATAGTASGRGLKPRALDSCGGTPSGAFLIPRAVGGPMVTGLGSIGAAMA